MNRYVGKTCETVFIAKLIYPIKLTIGCLAVTQAGSMAATDGAMIIDPILNMSNYEGMTNITDFPITLIS